MKTRRDDQHLEAQREQRRQLALDRATRQTALLDSVEELLFDFQDQPEQIALYLADLEELGQLSPADKEALYWDIAERLGRDVADRAIGKGAQRPDASDALSSLQAERDTRVTVSGGVATYPSSSNVDSMDALIRAADLALYRAKDHGKNRICAA